MSSENDIQIQVETQYLPNHLPPEEDKFAFSYRITITNGSEENLKLLNRYWLITDGNAKTSEVYGAGVVGEQPTIKPNQQYRYTSGAVLDTPVGTMQGHYEFRRPDGSQFKAPIPLFSLAVPNALN
ncbi:MAG: Co2+/Mg2+ efflux protein ApaG [Aestuariibacter sp.]